MSDSVYEEDKLESLRVWPLLKRLIGFARDQKFYLFLGLGATLFSALVRVGLPQLVRLGIDGYMTLGPEALEEGQQGLKWLALGFVGLLTLGFFLEYGVAIALNHVGQTAVKRVRNLLWQKFHRLPISYFDRNAVGRLVTRVTNDVNALADLFTSVLATGAADVLLFFGILAAMAHLNPQLTLVLAGLCPFMIALTFWFKNSSTKLHRKIRVLVARINAFFQESIQGLQVIWSFSAAQEVERRFAELNQEALSQEISLIHRVALFRPGFAVAQVISTALVLGYGGQLVLEKQLTLGGLVAFLFYLRMLFSPLQEMAEKFNVFQRAVVASERIFKILDQEEEPQREGAADSQQGTVVFDKVHFHYTPDKPVLKGVSFKIEPGQTVALVGPTGSGKSTTISLLLGFYPLLHEQGHQGSIKVDGLPIEHWSLTELRQRMGLVFQDLFLFSGNLRHNVTLFRQLSDSALEEALQVSRGDTVVARTPKGLQQMVGDGGLELSTGERQLLSFARALAGQPTILILDEATANIDSKTEAEISEALNQLLAGRTALVVAHRLATVKDADKILVLQAGEIAEAGTHEELLAKDGLYAKMYAHQLWKAKEGGSTSPARFNVLGE